MDESPFTQFEKWYQEAVDQQVIEPNALSLATVDGDGRPTLRTVLLKYFDSNGFVFYTNYNSRKAKQIENNANVAMLFQWIGMTRQVEINGHVEKVSAVESIKYFASRPRESQIGAWVSNQSSVVPTRSLLKNKMKEYVKKFASGSIPKPDHWGGFRLIPQRFEYWQGGANRLHDRIEYSNLGTADQWLRQRLAP